MKWFFIGFIVLGLSMSLTSIIFYSNNLPLSGTTALLMGLALSVGVALDWRKFKRKFT